ncbi:MAG: glycosyltransferase [Cyclobacteriaceae bacterium]|nr:glycosyltransferase [Cyclobacteriaceae bacterium]
MKHRIQIPSWVRQHRYPYTSWREIPENKLQELRNGLARFLTARPVVSIVIPVWNEEKNLVRTLSTFASMEIPVPTELIIVNNNSTDATQEILDKLGVRTVMETRQGIAHARLAGLRASRGEYELCGDGDSMYPPRWIKTMLRALQQEDVTCVYGNYSFLPTARSSRVALGAYEIMAESLFEFRRLRREFLNVRGANFGFRTAEGIAVKGFEMPVTRVFDNDEKSGKFVVFGEDGRMGRKLGELGKLKLVRSPHARIWTSSRRLLKDGSLFNAFMKRIGKETGRLMEYAAGPKKLTHTTDSFHA